MLSDIASNGLYFDNNATTKVAPELFESMRFLLEQQYGNPSSLHRFGEIAKESLQRARVAIAASIHADPEEIIITSSGSEANSLCIRGYVASHKHEGNHIITSAIEHPSVLQTCLDLVSEGYAVDVIGVDSDGAIDLEELERTIRPDTILISVMHANNEIGTIQPLEKIAALGRQSGIAVHSDMVQSFQKVPINVHGLGVDLASFSGHKIHAPKGVGFAYRKKGIALKRQLCGGNQEFGLRAGTENVSFVVALAEAIALALPADIMKMRKQQEDIIGSLLRIPGIRLNGPRSQERRICNNINVSFAMLEGEFVLRQLSKRGVFVSTGSACSSQSTRISSVLQAIRCPAEYIHGNIRIGLSKYTTDEEIAGLLHHLRDILSSFS